MIDVVANTCTRIRAGAGCEPRKKEVEMALLAGGDRLGVGNAIF